MNLRTATRTTAARTTATRTTAARTTAARTTADRSTAARTAAIAPDRAAELLVLLTGDATDVLARLLAGDPLQLTQRFARSAARRALLQRPARGLALAGAHCAERAEHYRGKPGIEAWLDQRIDEVAGELERHTQCAAAPRASGDTADQELDRASARFNACPRADREALHRLAFQGADLDALARAESATLGEVARRARRALDALLFEVRS